MDYPEDLELVRRCRAGDIDSFQGLVEKYQRRIYLLIYGIVLDREQARDLAQEAFLKAYRSLKSFRGRSGFYTWLYRIAFNLALDEKRKRAGREIFEYDDTRQLDPARRPGGSFPLPDRVLLGKELREALRRGLEELSPVQRTAIVLREWDGRSYGEIARIMKCSRGTVMSRLHYGREKLREALRPYLAGTESGREIEDVKEGK